MTPDARYAAVAELTIPVEPLSLQPPVERIVRDAIADLRREAVDLGDRQPPSLYLVAEFQRLPGNPERAAGVFTHAEELSGPPRVRLRWNGRDYMAPADAPALILLDARVRGRPAHLQAILRHELCHWWQELAGFEFDDVVCDLFAIARPAPAGWRYIWGHDLRAGRESWRVREVGP